MVRTGLAVIAAIEAEWRGRWRKAGGQGDIQKVLELALLDAAQSPGGPRKAIGDVQ